MSGKKGFAQALATKYRGRLAAQTLMVNELYLAVLYRPIATVRHGLDRPAAISSAGPTPRASKLSDALDACGKLGADIAGVARPLRAGASRGLRRPEYVVLFCARVFGRIGEW